MNKALVLELNYGMNDFDDQLTNCGVIKLEVVKMHMKHSHTFDIVDFFCHLMDFYNKRVHADLQHTQNDTNFQIANIFCNAVGYEVYLSFNSLLTSRDFKYFFDEFFFEFNVNH